MLGSWEKITQGFVVQAALSDPDVFFLFDKKHFLWFSAIE